MGRAAVGLVIAGVVPTDPALGYPPGAPEPASVSVPAAVHQVGGALVFAGLIGAAIVVGRWFSRHGNPIWARCSFAVAAAVAAPTALK